MLNSLAGGDALEIIVALKDLSSAGFTKLEGNLKHLEGTANATNMGGFSKATKTAEADAAKLAGSKGGGGIMGLASGMLSLAGGPVTLVAAGLAAAAGAGVLLTRTYDEVAQSEALLKAAGFGLSREMSTVALRPQAGGWADAGYIVILPTHVGSDSEAMAQGGPPPEPDEYEPLDLRTP